MNYSMMSKLHDECRTEVSTEDSVRFGRLATASIEAAGLHDDLNGPHAGEYQIGDNWSETHD